ncbi:disulfide bond formation protein B [Thiohalorhabdus methylotrophus]|uniref:Disulfide bond formation protein B n=1 Tax=Thiohalorhabdus methylotrophus TaxID=3242694 RepID=A0ABV4TYJ3_9GAMM
MRGYETREWWPFPALDIWGAILCGLLVLGGYALQWLAGMEPCPFCLLERYLLMGLGAAFVVSLWLRPRGWTHWVAGGLLLLPAGAGLAATIHHLRVQSGAAPSACGEPAAGPLSNQGLPMASGTEPTGPSGWQAWLPEATASCADPDLFLGINLVLWALAAFAALGGVGVLAHFVMGIRSVGSNRL